MNKIIPVLALILTSNIAYAKPIYLDCSIMSVTIDESNGKITHTYNHGNSHESFVADGFFSENYIEYKKVKVGSDGSSSVYQYSIDRSSLLLKQSSYLQYSGEDEHRMVNDDSFECKIAKIKHKKI
jgi:hypothetical protein